MYDIGDIVSRGGVWESGALERSGPMNHARAAPPGPSLRPSPRREPKARETPISLNYSTFCFTNLPTEIEVRRPGVHFLNSRRAEIEFLRAPPLRFATLSNVNILYTYTRAGVHYYFFFEWDVLSNFKSRVAFSHVGGEPRLMK